MQLIYTPRLSLCAFMQACMRLIEVESIGLILPWQAHINNNVLFSFKVHNNNYIIIIMVPML